MLRKTGFLLIMTLLIAGLLPAAIYAQDTENTEDAVIGDCGDPATLISEVQGDGLASELVNTEVTVEGVVTADYQESNQLQGFFMQEEAADADDDPATSEGIFVYKSGQAVETGDLVRVTGKVIELKASGVSLTQLSNIKSRVTVCGAGEAIAPVEITLPVDAVDDLEPFEGMVVSFLQELTVNDIYNLGRYGEILLSVEGRLYEPTNVARPGSRAQAVAEDNARRSIILDDGSPEQDSDPTLYPAGGLSAENTIRAGDTITGITGVLDQRYGDYRIEPLAVGEFVPTNARTAAPDPVNGRLTVASFNVLNYFNGNGEGGGFPTPRGANTPFEFERQESKLVSAILAINADIVGLIEIENDGDGPESAVASLVDALNEAAGEERYAYVPDPAGWVTRDGDADEIKQAIIYNPATVRPTGDPVMTIEPPYDGRRPPLAQAFIEEQSNQQLIVVVNHFKAKGCDGAAAAGDGDQGDGQSCWNNERMLAAQRLADWLATNPTGITDPDVLLIGDFNAYTFEDPMMILAQNDYVNLMPEFASSPAYSYIYYGQAGALDHTLASESLLPQVSGVTTWHINADEAHVLDYNVEYKTANHVETLYAPDAYRSSDHDPVVIGLILGSEDPVIMTTTPKPTEEPTVAPTEEPTIAP
ncbi:MAG: ExeM/NucH family extracellular endonuclease, partial [Anaerolineae bacterium]|nr:ExeM/NucH family extracellular endonuclease [Anaerolineae bacterium]